MGATWATVGRLGDGPARGALSELWKLPELTETDAKMDAQGWLWEPVGALKGLLGRYCTTLETVRATFWHNFGVLEATFR